MRQSTRLPLPLPAEKPRVLVVGGHGYVGSALVARMRAAWGVKWRNVVHPTARWAVDDPDDPNHLGRLIRESTAVVNAAGWVGSVNSDSCEEEVAESFRDNLELPRRLSREVAQWNPGIPVHHISTGCLYQGAEGLAGEDDPLPPSERVYLTHKRLAEEEVLSASPNNFVWRIRMPFDGRVHRNNLLCKLLRFPVFSPGRESVTSLCDLGDALVAAMALGIQGGIFNAANPEPASLREMALCLKVDRPEGETGLIRRRVTMDCKKLQNALGEHYPFRRTLDAVRGDTRC